MTPPSIPANEQLRLDTLRALNILDTSAEERFDRLTRLARRLFGVPIALVSLVDANRQWFKSCIGLSSTESPREVSFCGHAILDDGILLVPDALLDERFHDNPLVVDEPGIRFYAGCPLSVANGSKLGTLCLIDVQPREFGEEDRALLRDLARMAEQELAALQLATMDELTLLSNRRGFSALAQHALNVCKRLDKPATLLFFDLDNFKGINDRFGHAEGDRALSVFAAQLRQSLRDSDVIGRLGGDEFVALLTGSNAALCQATLARLKSAMDAINEQAARGYDIAFSVGSVQFDAARHDGTTALLAEADAAMYANKASRKASQR
ncbi:sensor domain-containing diguanylate cyclase [Cupriavidus basilensis]|uniref:Sensor domain-containing diguanylate cyclase n=2 Tax=Cupriavidus basilensis TaxID=68895 RepID=A0A643G2R0_9BURK|nr:sensor domain-containing diguanylate cyclase [Cupriavidus basilensis]QOT78708.1 sensor domain-containing diguanylate cyclase [Cupriavidus basilensis]